MRTVAAVCVLQLRYQLGSERIAPWPVIITIRVYAVTKPAVSVKIYNNYGSGIHRGRRIIIARVAVIIAAITRNIETHRELSLWLSKILFGLTLGSIHRHGLMSKIGKLG